MIRAGRRDFVQSSADLAKAMGLALGTFRNRKPYAAADFPAPVSPVGAKTMLWDGEQTAAFLAGAPVPALPEGDDDEDLLERIEAAAVLGVAPDTWNHYKRDPRIAPHLVSVKGVEHCPRRILRAFREAPAQVAGAHRPKGSGDMVPRDELDARVGELLETDPALTLARVQDELGIAYSTAARVVPRLRGVRIADLVAGEEGLSLEQAAERLGYPSVVRRAAIARAVTELRSRHLQSYVQEVADALAAEGLAERQDVAVVQVGDDVVAAAVVLSSTAPVPALVWDERWGWRTAANRRHPIGRETGQAPEGEGIRYLSSDRRPAPQEILAAVYDGRTGTSRPPG
ncbi:DUF6292 family protein [Streptomyces sp. NPDC050400]|uniref:DUF6292 family protein n=1 Tax=Streptomyces sp. NPDC050400 TaxID=3365610 RepID=UPI0037A6E4F2